MKTDAEWKVLNVFPDRYAAMHHSRTEYCFEISLFLLCCIYMTIWNTLKIHNT